MYVCTYLAFHSWSIKGNVVYPFWFTQAEVLAFSIMFEYREYNNIYRETLCIFSG